MAITRRSKITGAWRIPDFRRYWTAQSVSFLGDQVSVLAIPLVAVTLLQASASQMGILTALSQAPILIFGLVAGVWVDQADRRRLLIITDLGRAGVIALIPIMAFADVLSLPLVMAVVFASATLGVGFSIAAAAYLPEIVPHDRLIDANARISQPRAVAQVAGPGLGGALVQAVSAPVAIILDALSFVASAVLLSRNNTTPSRQSPEDGAGPGVITAIRQGLHHVWHQPLLRASAAAAGTYNLFNAAVLAVLVLHLSRTMHLSPAEIGLVMAAGGPGALLGATLATAITRRIGLGPAMIAGLVMAGAGILIIQLAHGPHVTTLLIMLVAIFLNGLGQPLYNVNQSGLRQAIVPARLLGRVQATLSVLAGAAAPIGAIIGGLTGQWLGTRTALLLAGAGAVAASGWLLCSPIRTLTQIPADT